MGAEMVTNSMPVRARRCASRLACAAGVLTVLGGVAGAQTPAAVGQSAETGAGAAALARTASLAPRPETAPQAAAEVAPKPRVFTRFGAAVKAALKGSSREVFAAYDAADFQPIWGRLSSEQAAMGRNAWVGAPKNWSEADKLIAALAQADAHALPARRYKVEELRAALATLRSAIDAARLDEPQTLGESRPVLLHGAEIVRRAAELERALSETFALYAGDLSSGAIDPLKEIAGIYVSPARPNAAVVLAKLRMEPSPGSAILAYEPKGRDYQALKAEYAALTKLAAGGDYGAAHRHRRALREGASGKDVASARARLQALGYLAPGANAVNAKGAALMDAAMAEAVRRFQAENGLLADGEVGRVTSREMNRSAAERARQVAVNLERARWHDYNLPVRHVRVNIPDYHMDVMERGASAFRSRVVVGKPKHATPEFSDEMTHVVVNPLWHVPRSIATKELLPQIQQDPGVIQQKNMRLIGAGGVTVDPWAVDWTQITRANFPFRIKQDSGNWNALGEVKFIFPNRHSIYLHDTPSKRLFRKPLRAFSHGCVRVARPRELAEVLLSEQRPHDAAQYYRRLRRIGAERYVQLHRTVPVHLLYRTAWVEADGRLQSRRDIYGRDRRVAAALEKAGVALP